MPYSEPTGTEILKSGWQTICSGSHFSPSVGRFHPFIGPKALRKSRGIALLYFDLGTRRGWGVTPRSPITPGKDPVAIVQGTGWTSEPVWILHVCPAVKLRMFSSHWFVNRSSCFYFCGINWPLPFPPSLISQFPRHDHSIHLNRIRSPWNRKHHISSKRQNQLMNISTGAYLRRGQAP
jgi:hypothetical protein